VYLAATLLMGVPEASDLGRRLRHAGAGQAGRPP
jgi:hypothetical protein